MKKICSNCGAKMIRDSLNDRWDCEACGNREGENLSENKEASYIG